MSWTSMRAARTKCRDSWSLPASAGGVAVVEQDQVDVARVVELAGAELAHAQHGQGGGLGIRADAELAVAGELQQDRSGQRVQAARGKGTERAGHLLERPCFGDVGDGDSERHPALELPERRCHGSRRGAVACGGSHRGELGCEVGAHGIGAATPQIGHKSRVLYGCFGQIRAVAEQGIEQRHQSGIVGPRRYLVPSRPCHVATLRVVRSRQAVGRKPRHVGRGSVKLFRSWRHARPGASSSSRSGKY